MPAVVRVNSCFSLSFLFSPSPHRAVRRRRKEDAKTGDVAARSNLIL